MNPARQPSRPRDSARLLVVDPALHHWKDSVMSELSRFLRPNDIVVVNDAATIPASLKGRTASAADIELRLVSQLDGGVWLAALFGAGDWRIATELRDPPERLEPGSCIVIGEDFGAEVIDVSPKSPRLVRVRFSRQGEEFWTAIYAYGKPIQYSYLSSDMDLWSVQTLYAGRPWAVEMPSAGESISWRTIGGLRQKGIAIASLTHAAGISAIGDENLDAMLPLPERYDLPGATIDRIGTTKASGGRVIAIGTTVVRALEGAALQNGGALKRGAGITDLVVTSEFQPKIVDGIITGMHEPGGSHFRLLRAFSDELTLRRAWRHATEAAYRSHEFGDVCLIARGSLNAE
jgi:S-adenosylmethionine:tRNA ribosyltransferase-isomerase